MLTGAMIFPMLSVVKTIDVVFLFLPDQSIPADPEQFGSSGVIMVTLNEGVDDQFPFVFFDVQTLIRFFG